MFKQTLLEFFERDLIKLKEEIDLYQEERLLWILNGEIANTAGNLCLHLTGNLNHFIGATLGNTGYIRDRDSEFNLKNVPRKMLIADIENTQRVVLSTLKFLPDAGFAKNFPLEKHGKDLTTENMLIHLLGHLNYHLGQINYHRRLVS